MHKVRMAAIERLRREMGTSPLLVLEQDIRLQMTLASWRFIEFREDHAPRARKIDDLPVSELVKVAWDGVSFSEGQVESILESVTVPGRKVRQAMKLGLGYPDGTIHPLAEQWIAMKVQSMIQSRAKPKRKT